MRRFKITLVENATGKTLGETTIEFDVKLNPRATYSLNVEQLDIPSE